MKYLIFRTDRIGDFLIILPLIKALKVNNPNSKISVVTSSKNINFVKQNYLVDDVFVLKSNKITDKIKLFFKLNKFSYDVVIVSDKKNRSIILSLLLKAKKKIFNVSKNYQKKLLNFFFKNVFLDNDSLENTSIKEILKKNCTSLDIKLNDNHYKFFQNDYFKKHCSVADTLELENIEYIVIHCDEKWEIENYSRLFKKATNLTNIKLNKFDFINFLSRLSIKKSKKIIITTGYLNTNIVNDLKKDSRKINPNLYEVDLNNEKCYLITNQNFFSTCHLISKSKLFISCHGAFTHIASNYNIKILDIIEKNKKNHYLRITNHMKNYNILYRKDSSYLLDEIVNYS